MTKWVVDRQDTVWERGGHPQTVGAPSQEAPQNRATKSKVGAARLEMF